MKSASCKTPRDNYYCCLCHSTMVIKKKKKKLKKQQLNTRSHLHVAPLERVIKAASKLAVFCTAGTSPNRLDERRGQQVHGGVDIVSSLYSTQGSGGSIV